MIQRKFRSLLIKRNLRKMKEKREAGNDAIIMMRKSTHKFGFNDMQSIYKRESPKSPFVNANNISPSAQSIEWKQKTRMVPTTESISVKIPGFETVYNNSAR